MVDLFYKDKNGFTIIELMIVLIIIVVLVAVAVPIYSMEAKNAKKHACQSNLRTLDGAAWQYYVDTGSWPSADNWYADLHNYLKAEPHCPLDETKEYIFNTSQSKFECPNDKNGHVYP